LEVKSLGLVEIKNATPEWAALMHCDMVVRAFRMLRACVQYGPLVGSGSVLVPERFRDPASHRGRQEGFFLGEKHEKLSGGEQLNLLQ
jgi:hypothetical protein